LQIISLKLPKNGTFLAAKKMEHIPEKRPGLIPSTIKQWGKKRDFS